MAEVLSAVAPECLVRYNTQPLAELLSVVQTSVAPQLVARTLAEPLLEIPQWVELPSAGLVSEPVSQLAVQTSVAPQLVAQTLAEPLSVAAELPLGIPV